MLSKSIFPLSNSCSFEALGGKEEEEGTTVVGLTPRASPLWLLTARHTLTPSSPSHSYMRNDVFSTNSTTVKLLLLHTAPRPVLYATCCHLAFDGKFSVPFSFSFRIMQSERTGSTEREEKEASFLLLSGGGWRHFLIDSSENCRGRKSQEREREA